MTNILLQPVEVVRGQYGYWVHPDLSKVLKTADEEFATKKEWSLFKQQQNIETATTYFESDAPADIVKRYGDGEYDASEWNPTTPDGEGWFMLSIHDTEDMPVCVWARRLENEKTPKAANCQYCDDGDGGCIFPHFGLAPHIHVGEQIIGSTQFLDQSSWPANFSPDKSGTGVYTHCLSCGAPDTDIPQQGEQNNSSMIKAFTAINARRQQEEMPINPLAMFAEAWDFRQAEIDRLQADFDRTKTVVKIAEQILVEENICQLAKLIVSWPVEEETLKKYQGLVQGYLDHISATEDNNILLCDENQKLRAEIERLRQIIAELDIAKERLQLAVNAQSQNKEGYVLVPVEPTPKMIDATWNYDDKIHGMSSNKRNEFIYKAMIKAAQEASK